MHYILQGILPIFLDKFIRHCFKKYVPLDQLNDCIAEFKYGHKEMSSKPCAITKTLLNAEKWINLHQKYGY
jgi:hypothetical protein